MAQKAECDGLCFSPELNMWQYNTFQSGAENKQTNKKKKIKGWGGKWEKKAETVSRKWATWIIAGYKKKLCVGWI